MHIKLLNLIPVKRTRNDNSETAFEYICGRLKVSGKQLDDLLEFIKNGPSEESDDSDEYEEDDELSLEDVAKLLGN